jgi:hypothetical protein
VITADFTRSYLIALINMIEHLLKRFSAFVTNLFSKIYLSPIISDKKHNQKDNR